MTTQTDSSNPQTLSDVETIIAQAAASGSRIKIAGYIDSAGDQKDITVAVKYGGYKSLVAESLRWLASGEYLRANPGGFTHMELVQAADELTKSWQQSLSAESIPKGGLVDSGKGYFTDPSKTQQTVCLVGVINDDDVPVKLDMTALGKAQDVRVRNAIKALSPLRKYIPRLNLAIGKFCTVTLA